MKTIADIEAEARRLCGDEFEVINHSGTVKIRPVSMEFQSFAVFSLFGFGGIEQKEDWTAEQGKVITKLIAICSQLDKFIKGD